MSLRLVPRASPRTNLLAGGSPLVGRGDVLARIEGELARGYRLVTVVGPPGMGKTRVAKAALERLGAERYLGRGGAWFCDLSHARDAADLVHAMLVTLTGRAADTASLEELSARLEHELEGAGETLLVLDNFEQITFTAPLVARLLERAAGLVVLVTSRERLGVSGEVVVELSPLGCPEPGSTTPSEATTLFLERARAAGGTMPGDFADVAAIVRRLEGIPLAIELAAARTRVLSARELLVRLGRGHDVLGSAKGGEGRHATLANAIAWSWDLLSEGERVALARLSVFAGGFTVGSAEPVLGADAVELVASLRDKSLVFSGSSGRLGLYVSVRDVARARLAELGPAAEAEALEAHARAFAAEAERFVDARTLVRPVPGTSAFADLRAEKENLVAALEVTKGLERAPFAPHARAMLASALALLSALPADAALSELDGALAALAGLSLPVTEAHVRLARQSVRCSVGLYAECLEDLAWVADTAALPSGLRTLARVYQGIQLRYQGHAARALPFHERADEALADGEFPRLRRMNDACMGRLAVDLRDEERARLFNTRALAACEAAGDTWLGALALANLAQLEQDLGALDEAHALLERAVARLAEVGETQYESIYAGVLGDLFFERERPDEARAWYLRGAGFLGRVLTQRQTGILHASAAALEASEGNVDAARGHLLTARACSGKIDNPVVHASVDLHAASFDLVVGRTPEARRRATELLSSFRDGGPRNEAFETSLDVRFAARMLTRAVEGRGDAARTLGVLEAERVLVSPTGERLSLGRRGSLWRIALALVTRHERGEASGLDVLGVFEVGWPGERATIDAARTRVRVAVATLRKSGLRDTILTRDDGYLLDPHVVVAREK